MMMETDQESLCPGRGQGGETVWPGPAAAALCWLLSPWSVVSPDW